MSFKTSERRIWDTTATLEALGGADVALWIWEPEADRLRLNGAARALGLPRTTLRDRLRKYGLR